MDLLYACMVSQKNGQVLSFFDNKYMNYQQQIHQYDNPGVDDYLCILN